MPPKAIVREPDHEVEVSAGEQCFHGARTLSFSRAIAGVGEPCARSREM